MISIKVKEIGITKITVFIGGGIDEISSLSYWLKKEFPNKIYEMFTHIEKQLSIVKSIFSDDNYLNNQLAKSNQLFDELLELEDAQR
jgi:hypothetical protein